MIRDPGGLETARQRRELAQIRRVERVGRAEVQRDAVQRQRPGGPHLAKHARRAATRHQVVLADRLEPVDRQLPAPRAREHLGIVLRAQPDAEAEAGSLARPRGELRHRASYCFECFSLAAAHSSAVIISKPLPLHEFLPAQELLALEQEPLPLHSFTPSHLILASLLLWSWATAWPAAPAMKSAAAADASVTARDFTGDPLGAGCAGPLMPEPG